MYDIIYHNFDIVKLLEEIAVNAQFKDLQ